MYIYICIYMYVYLSGVGLVDLCCFWTGANTLPSAFAHEKMVVKFDGGANKLPMSEACFLNIILPTQHKEYEEFRNNLDIALKYRSKGFTFS